MHPIFLPYSTVNDKQTWKCKHRVYRPVYRLWNQVLLCRVAPVWRRNNEQAIKHFKTIQKWNNKLEVRLSGFALRGKPRAPTLVDQQTFRRHSAGLKGNYHALRWVNENCWLIIAQTNTYDWKITIRCYLRPYLHLLRLVATFSLLPLLVWVAGLSAELHYRKTGPVAVLIG